LGTFPFKYLGVPLHHEKLKKEDIQPVVDKTINRIPGWKGKLLSYSARLTFLKACLASIPIYLMSVIKFSKWAIRIRNSHMSKFFGMIRRRNISIICQIGNHCVKRKNMRAWVSLI
jgi:hypothetical protein